MTPITYRIRLSEVEFSWYSTHVDQEEFYLLILSHILEQHLEEAVMLSSRRMRYVLSPLQNLATVTKLDWRIDAHLDGLNVDTENAWILCETTLKFDEAGEVFVGVQVALAGGDPVRIQKIVEIACAAPHTSAGLIAALGWLPYPRIASVIQPLSTSEIAEQRYIAVAAQALHRVSGDWVQKALHDTSVLVQARACRAVGELGRADLVPQLQALHQSKEETVAFWSCWSAALLGDLSAVTALKRFAIAPEYTDDALAVVLRRLLPQAAGLWLEELAQDEVNVRLVIRGAGIVGDPVFVPGLISTMSMPELARVAAESFCNITGVNLADAKLEAAPPPVNDDEPVQADADDELPWPDPPRVFEWWKSNGARYEQGMRYLLSQPATPEHLQSVLRHGNQKQRYGAALELAMLKPGTLLFATDAPGALQQQRLGR